MSPLFHTAIRASQSHWEGPVDDAGWDPSLPLGEELKWEEVERWQGWLRRALRKLHGPLEVRVPTLVQNRNGSQGNLWESL